MKPNFHILLGSTALSRIGTLTAGIALFSANAAVALPQNGSVVGGSASIAQTSPSQLDITQTSNRAVIDWQSFSIGANESTIFHQPSANSIAVNRVTGVDPSQIMGRLTANGQVVLVNPNGILFGKGARVDVGGLVASTSGITTQNAMDGTMSFDEPGKADATIENRGVITAAEGGLVALVAPGVANSGTITATMGKVSLASGNKWTMDLYGDHLVNFAVNDQVAGKVIGVTQSGRISAQTVELSANVAKGIVSNAINMSGIIEATSATTQDGTIILSAPNSGVAITGTVDASGSNGGTIGVTGDSIIHQGTIDADGFAGAGGSVALAASSTYIDTANATTSAQGTTKGGSIAVSAGTSLYTSGTHKVTSSHGVGGSVTMTAPTTNIVGASIDASGATGGGQVSIGGGPHGGGTLTHATTTNVTPSSIISANATQGGNGGVITIWSDEDTSFAGTTYAKGGVSIGNGGTIEVSSAGSDHYAGSSDASAPMGSDGQLLLDPKTINVDTVAALFPQFQFLNPNASASGTFGSVTVDLSGGNVVISDPTATIGLGPAATGAAYLFSGLTGQLISALTGTYTGDRVGANVTASTNGNFVVSESTWNGGRGAATWANGATGVTGAVSVANSLTGSALGDNVGLNVTALSNGNFVVGSSNWNGGIGAATWASGSIGISGTVSAANSLIGSSTSDHVGLGVTALNNGDFVVQSPNWNGNRGAASWANGSVGITGTVSAANSLIGSNANDEVGLTVTALTSGDYVVGSPNWTGTKGAASWADGSIGITGTVTTANSLIGSSSGDEIGLNVTALSNGAYVVGSPDWNGYKGAASWGNGTSSITGTVTASNSLIGSLAGDKVGLKITALAGNGNYVVGSPNWTLNTGAATWGNGGVGVTGTISYSNSLIGSSAGDEVGINLTALTNGNYVVGSPDWALAKGAATWGNGTIGVHGAISSSNSLVGSTATDQIGLGVTALTNGNYVVQSPLWDATLGAATFASGTVGLTGTVSSANSLVGSLPTDEVGLHVTALTVGNYVVGSPLWNGTIGAATWASGTIGITGVVSSANSLTGNLVGDLVGSSVTALTAGAYVVGSLGWNSGHGAATYGTAALTGMVSAANSIVGSGILTTPLVTIGSLADGNFTVSFASAAPGSVYEGFTNPNQLTYNADANGIVTIAPNFITKVLNTGTAVTLQADDDIQIDNPIITNAGGAGGTLTLQAGRSLILNASIATDNGNLTLIANDTAADGVVNTARDPGNAIITMANGTALNAGTGAISILMNTGAGITNAGAGGIALNTITGNTISIVDQTQNTLTMNGAMTATAAGNSIVTATGIITNNYGMGVLNPGAGRYLLYSANPTANMLNGVTNYTKRYSSTLVNSASATITTGGNYAFYSLTPTVTISAVNATRTYGAVNPTLTYSVSGLIDGDTVATALASAPTIATSAVASSSIGAYSITPSGTLTSPIGYNVVTAQGTLSVTPAALTITSDNASKIYSAANPGLSASYTGLVNGDTSSVVSGLSLATVATTASSVGSYAITAAGAVASNYSISYGSNGVLSILQAPLTITAENASRLYGANNPAFSAAYSGLVNGDSSGVVTNMMMTTAATPSSNVGAYAITASNGMATNYAITYVNGTLSVTPAPLTITSANASRLYGQNNPAFSASYSGLVNGDASSVVSGLSLSTIATSTANVGTYAISATNASALNYIIAYGPSGLLSVTPAALTITPNAATRLYGGNNLFSASFAGLTAGDTSAAISGLALSSTATSSSNVGSYAITAAGASDANYAISYGASSVLTITPNPLTITPNNSTRLPDTANALSASYSGLAGGDTPAAISGLTLATSATSASPIGQYAITASGASDSNYTIAYGPNGTLSIVATLPQPPQPAPTPIIDDPSGIPLTTLMLLTNGPIEHARFDNPPVVTLTPIVFPVTTDTQNLVASADATVIPTLFPVNAINTNLVASTDRNNFSSPYIFYNGDNDTDPKMVCLKVSLDSTGTEVGSDQDDSCAAPLSVRGF